MGNYMSNMASAFGGQWDNNQDVEVKITVNPDHLPIMYTKEGDLVCIPYENDEHDYGVIGQRGAGKSYFFHAFIDRTFHYRKNFVCLLNDWQVETISWYIANKSDTETLKRFGEVPCGLPVAYCAPAYKENNYKFEYFNISMPFKEFLKHTNFFMKLDKSEKYFDMMREDVEEAEDLDEFVQIVQEFELDIKNDENIKTKIIASFREMIDLGIVSFPSDDNNLHDINIRMGLDEAQYSPYPGFMVSKLMPILLTRSAIGTKFYHGYFKWLIEMLYDNQVKDPIFGDKRSSLIIGVDELPMITRGSKENSALIEKIAAQGRPNRIGMIYNTQKYSSVPEMCRDNTEYLFVLKQSNSKEVNTIARDKDLKNYYKDKIPSLRKFEILAITDNKFVVYHKDGSVDKNVRDPILGRSLPTLSLHTAPTTRIGGNDDEN